MDRSAAKQQFTGGVKVGKRISTEYSVEIDDVFVVKRLGRSVEAWCPGCQGKATMLTPEDAATLVATRARFIYRLIELGEIHSTEVAGDLLLVCVGSLLEQQAEQVLSNRTEEGK